MKKIHFIIIGAFLAFALLGSLGFSAVNCCIAGDYKGFHEDIRSRTCLEPGEGHFKMTINQEAKCGSKVWGTIIDASGVLMNFEGTVTPGPDEYCTLEAKGKNASGETVEFTVILYKSAGKWLTKDGKYVHSNGCKGKVEITQI